MVVGQGILFYSIGDAMSVRPKLTADEIATIIDHVTPLLDGVSRSLAELPSNPSGEARNYIVNQRRYLKQAVGTLRWVIRIAEQRGE